MQAVEQLIIGVPLFFAIVSKSHIAAEYLLVLRNHFDTHSVTKMCVLFSLKHSDFTTVGELGQLVNRALLYVFHCII